MRRLAKLMTFTALAYVPAYLLDLALKAVVEAWGASGPLIQAVLIARMWIPGLAALAVIRLSGERVAEGVRKRGLRTPGFWGVALAVAAPYVAYGVGALLSLLMGYRLVNPVEKVLELMEVEPRAPPLTLLVVQLAASGVMGATFNAVVALGEELGWRGFLLDEVESAGLRRGAAAVLVGVVWGFWHAPLILLFGYNYPHHRDALGIAAFTAFCAIWSVTISSLKPLGGLYACAAAHGTLNALGGSMLLTVDVEDELLTMPVGIVGLAAGAITATLVKALALRLKPGAGA